MFEYERFREIPKIIEPILRALEVLDDIKKEEFYYGGRHLTPRRLTGRILLLNAIKRKLIGQRSIDGIPINVIPPIGEPGPCADILLVFIGEADSFELRVLEAIEHCGVLCHGKTRCVIFYALKWDDAIWKKHEQSFKIINAVVILKPFGRPFTRIL